MAKNKSIFMVKKENKEINIFMLQKLMDIELGLYLSF